MALPTLRSMACLKENPWKNYDNNDTTTANIAISRVC